MEKKIFLKRETTAMMMTTTPLLYFLSSIPFNTFLLTTPNQSKNELEEKNNILHCTLQTCKKKKKIWFAWSASLVGLFFLLLFFGLAKDTMAIRYTSNRDLLYCVYICIFVQ